MKGGHVLPDGVDSSSESAFFTPSGSAKTMRAHSKVTVPLHLLDGNSDVRAMEFACVRRWKNFKCE